MNGQLTVYDWKPSCCPGTKEFERLERKRKKEAIDQQVRAKIKLDPKTDFERREYWFALAVAILRDDINSADDAISAMGIKRTNTKETV